jgi:hypothetical protein
VRYLRIAGAMALQYGLVVANTRFIARGSYAGTIGTDLVIAANGLFLVKAAVDAKTRGEQLAYIIGGSIGSAASLWITKWFT